MKKRNLRIVIFCILLFIVSFALRIFRLDQNSPALYADEAGHYWLYQSLISGKFNPLELLQWGTFSFTWAFGLNVFGVRFGSALFGSLVGTALFYLGYVVSQKKFSIAAICGMLGVVLPWSYMISRIGHTHIPIIVLLGSIHLGLLINAKNIKGFLLSLIPLALSVFYYPTMVVIAPLGVIYVFIKYFFPKFTGKQKQIFLIGGVVVSVLLGYVFITRYNVFSLQGRGGDLGIWRDINVTADFNKYRGLARLADPNTEKIANKIFFNYPASVAHVFVRNYLSFFTPDFLFLKGDNVLRHSIGVMGEFFPFLLPFMLYGAFLFYKNANQKSKITFTLWLLLSPIPAAITKDGATYLLRAVTMMPVLTYFCALGIDQSTRILKPKFANTLYIVSLLVIFTYTCGYFFFSYFYVYPALAADSYEYGFKELVAIKAENATSMLVLWEDKYPVNHFCFWQNLPVSQCASDKLNTKEQFQGVTIFHPLSDLFLALPENSASLQIVLTHLQPNLLTIPGKYAIKYPEIIKTLGKPSSVILNPDQTTAFSIYTLK